MKKNVLLLLTFLLCFPLVGFSENIIFENVTWSPTYIEAALTNGSLDEKTANSMRNYKFSLKIDDSKVSAFDKIGALKDPDDYYKSSYFQKEIKNDNYDIVILSLDPNAMPTIQERANSIMFSKSGDYIFYEYRKQGAYVLYEIPTNESNLKAWNRLIKMISDKNKIEPYQSTAVRDIRKKKDLTFDDIFYLARASTPLKELKKYYPVTYGDDHIEVKGSYTLYGRLISDFMIDKDYKDNWDVNTYIYFGETKSESALKEANKFMQDIYAYLIKRGRNVTMTMGSNSTYPDCYLLKFNEGEVREIRVITEGAYHKMNGELGWGVVIHMRYSYK